MDTQAINNTFNEQIKILKEMDPEYSAGSISDGYHTFEELYEFRLMYNATLFNEWAKNYDPKYSQHNQHEFPNPRYIGKHYNVHKSWKHFDGEWCFGAEKEWFIVSAMLPTGLISNRYKAEYWDLFKVPEVEQAMFEYDGHTSQDVLKRLRDLCSFG